MQKSDYMVLKGVNWLHNDKIRSNVLERSNLGTQNKNQVISSRKESIGYTMTKLGQMVLKGVIWAHSTKIRSFGLERSQLGTICKTKNYIEGKLKRSQLEYNDRIRSNGVERNHLGIQYKIQVIWS